MDDKSVCIISLILLILMLFRYNRVEHFSCHKRVRCLNPNTTDEQRSRFGCIPVNKDNRGIEGGFYQRGFLHKVDGDNALDKLPLFERKPSIKVNKKDNNNDTLYYTTNDTRNPLKIKIKKSQCQNNCGTLEHGDIVKVPEFNATYSVVRCSKEQAEKTDKCKPKYVPYRYDTSQPAVYWRLDFD